MGNTSQKFDESKPIGVVTQVDLTSVQMSIFQNSAQTDISVGDYVIVDCKTHFSIGQIADMKFKTATSKANLESNDKNSAAVKVATVELFASMHKDSQDISSGILHSPALMANIYEADPEIVQMLISSKFKHTDHKSEVSLQIGHLCNAEETPLSFSATSLFGRHLAVVGTTGAGKSWSIATLLEEIAKYKSKVILFDASGEYDDLPDGSVHVSVGLDPDPPKHVYQVAVPYYELRESDLYAIFKPSGRSQFPKMRAAIKSLKLAKLAPHIAIDGLIIKANRSKLDFESESRRFASELESPTADFNINCLAEQIENECVNPQRSAVEDTTWGGINNQDFSDCVSLMNRITDIIGSPNLSPIFNPGNKHSLFTVLRYFLTDDTQRILRISLQYLSYDHNAREIIVNAIARHMLEIARTGFFRTQPALMVVDEAHQFLNPNLLTGDHFPLDAFNLIAKEGRKYALNICLATQRPRDIPEGVISQMGTLIVHRLINDYDRQIVEKASASMDHNTACSIPVLAPGHCIMVGVDFPLPLSLKIKTPAHNPRSFGPDYQKYWGNE